ncbi:MAG: TadE/TadG family type IV pilus assembly protein [Acidobacteriaceae bacterium]
MSLKLKFVSAPLRQRHSGESGQALVETAISLSLLVVMLLGIAEIGNLAYAAMQVTSAATAAVQYGDRSRAAATDTTGMLNAAQAAAPLLPNLALSPAPTTSCICANGAASTCSQGDCPGSSIDVLLNVTTAVTFKPFIHLPGLPASFNLSGQAVQQVLSNY